MHNTYVMRDLEKFRKYNNIAKVIIEKRALGFKKVWKRNKYIHNKESNQRNYGEQLMKEANKLDNLQVPLDYSNKKGIRDLAKIGEVTASKMDTLLNVIYHWVTPVNTKYKQFLKFETKNLH